MMISPINKSNDKITKSLSEKNAKRIDKILTQFHLIKSEINKRIDRPSPLVPASLTLNDTILIGNDKNLWKKEKNKWIKLETNEYRIVFENQNNDIFNNIKYDKILDLYKSNLCDNKYHNKKIFIKQIISLNDVKINQTIIDCNKLNEENIIYLQLLDKVDFITIYSKNNFKFKKIELLIIAEKDNLKLFLKKLNKQKILYNITEN